MDKKVELILENYVKGTHASREDGAALLRDLEKFFQSYFILTDAQFVILAVWTLHTHVFDSFDYSPYLNIRSAAKRCGKSNLLTALGLLVARPWRTSSTSVANLARKIERNRCTMLLDESDAAFQGPREYTDALRGILNAGFEREGIYSRCVGEGSKQESKDFSVYCPKAIAGIGKLPDTVTDRSIPIDIKRKAPGERVERFRSRKVKPVAAQLASRITRWADQNAANLIDAEPAVIEELNDRAWDVCEPLMVISNLVGGDWPSRLREALLQVYSSDAAQDDDVGVRLLHDIKDILGDSDIPALEPLQPLQSSIDAGLSPFSQPLQEPSVADEKSAPEPHKQRVVAHVADENRRKGSGPDQDYLLGAAISLCREAGEASVRSIKDALGVSTAAAVAYIDAMQDMGLIGPANGSGPRPWIEGP